MAVVSFVGRAHTHIHTHTRTHAHKTHTHTNTHAHTHLYTLMYSSLRTSPLRFLKLYRAQQLR